jgi:hypothetical protein
MISFNFKSHALASLMTIGMIAVTGAAAGAQQKLTLDRPEFISKQPMVLGGACNMDSLNGTAWGSAKLTLSKSAEMTITGWGVDQDRKLAATEIFVRLQNATKQEFYAKAEMYVRDDILNDMKKPFAEKTGYKAVVDATMLPVGDYDAMIVMNMNGKSVLCSAGRKLAVTG